MRFHVVPKNERAGPVSGIPVVSRGMLNMATWPLPGSTLATMSVSVLYEPSPGRRSEPIRRTLSRPVPSQGDAAGPAGAAVAPGGGVESGASAASGDASGDGTTLADGSGVGSSSSFGLKTPWTRSSACRS